MAYRLQLSSKCNSGKCNIFDVKKPVNPHESIVMRYGNNEYSKDQLEIYLVGPHHSVTPKEMITN